MTPGNRDRTELGEAVRSYKKAFGTVALLSGVLNFLLLGGSIYMMLVYDSVLPSHSLPTLFGLLLMLIAVYAFQGLFDGMRARILGDIANAFAQRLSPRVQQVIATGALTGQRAPGDGLGPMRDLEQVRSFLASGGPAAMIDLPWIVFFLGILFLLHYWLGVTALVGAIILMIVTLQTNRLTREPTSQLALISAHRNNIAETHLRHAELIHVLGMRARMDARWQAVDQLYLAAQDKTARAVQSMGGVSKIFRLFLQSLILTIGALLVINGKASAGVIFASSILSGRALAPVDQAIANWRGFIGARLGWRRLEETLARIPAVPAPTIILPSPGSALQVQQLFVAPPGSGRLVVQGVDFVLEAGTGLGIVGPSAAGKSSLGKAIIGAWRPARGTVRLDGAAIDQWAPDALGRSIGFLPQSVELLDGTIAENIARFDPDRTSEDVIAAAKAANVHDMIVRLPLGYETPVGIDGGSLSAGQRQRIGLARALYKDPFLVVLDEPNSNLDAEGEAALTAAIGAVRARNAICIVIAHRPSALANVSRILVLNDGRMDAFGPRDEILEKILGKPRIISSREDSEPAEQAVPEVAKEG
jgi:ATP-binding cassette subfamily C protein